MADALKVGDLVRKVGGYPFPGKVDGKFVTSAGAERFNVESTVLPGLIHIFAGHQLVRDDGSDAIRVALDTLKREGVDVVLVLSGLLRMCEAARYTVGFSGNQIERMDAARAALAKLEGGQ